MRVSDSSTVGEGRAGLGLTRLWRRKISLTLKAKARAFVIAWIGHRGGWALRFRDCSLMRRFLWIGLGIGLSVLVLNPAFSQLEEEGRQRWTLGSIGIVPGGEEKALAELGRAVAAGDFNGDGLEDLAVGAPGFDAMGANEAGRVFVGWGTPDGIQMTNGQSISQGGGAADGREAEDHFGSPLAVGDFNGDGIDDLAVGVLGEDHSGVDSAGAVHVFFGSEAGLVIGTDQFLGQGLDGLSGGPAPSEAFGFSLAVGDFDDDGFDDLAMGVPGQTLAPTAQVGGPGFNGEVHVVFGSETGLDPLDDRIFNRNSVGIGGAPQSDEHFGHSLATGLFITGEDRAQLAVGAWGRDASGEDASGTVVLLSNLRDHPVTSLEIEQGVDGVLETSEPDDAFGWSLAAGDFDGDGEDELAVGAPGETLDGLFAAGIVHLVDLGAGAGHQVFPQAFFLGETNGALESFGRVLAAGDFDGRGFSDLAIGNRETVDGQTAAGSVQVVYGSVLGLVTVGNTWNQGLEVIEANDEFGGALSVGRFRPGSSDSLIVGIPGEDVSVGPISISNTGAVAVIHPQGIFSDGFESGDVDAWSGVQN